MNQEIETSLKYLKKGFDFLMSSELQTHLTPLKIASLIFFLGFIIVALYLIFKTEYITWTRWEFVYDFLKSSKIFGDSNFKRRWNRIKKMSGSVSESKRKLSLIDAHVILEETLKKMGHGGDTVEERLGQLDASQITNLEELKKTESFARDIFLNPEKELSRDKAKEIVSTFGRAFVDLEIL